ncbi:MAG TPA: PAS domain-containing protein, partial [Pseudolabrys sp.]
MPDTIRTANGRLRSRPWRGGFLAAFLTVAQCIIDRPAQAAPEYALGSLAADLTSVGHQQVATLTLTLGLLLFSVLAVIVLLRTRRLAGETATLSRDEVGALRAERDRLKALLMAEPQVLVSWAAGADVPEIVGDTDFIVPGGTQQRVLAFGAWLDASEAQQMERAVETLRAEGRGFAMNVRTRSGNPVEAEGRALGGSAILRLRDISGIERDLTDLTGRHERLKGDLALMRGLIDALPAPVWARDRDGRLIFVNAAYAGAVEAADAGDAVAREIELLDRSGRAEVLRARGAGEAYSGRLPAIARGERRMFDVVDVPNGDGSAGMAIDRTEAEAMRAELGRMIEAHRRVLDQLATGVAIFNVDRKLIFYNTAFRSLFDLDASLLDQTPTDASLLDTLRADRKLPEEQDFRLWKQQLYEAYR